MPNPLVVTLRENVTLTLTATRDGTFDQRARIIQAGKDESSFEIGIIAAGTTLFQPLRFSVQTRLFVYPEYNKGGGWEKGDAKILSSSNNLIEIGTEDYGHPEDDYNDLVISIKLS